MFPTFKKFFSGFGITVMLLAGLILIAAQGGAAAFFATPVIALIVLLAIGNQIANVGGRGKRAWAILASMDHAFKMNLPLPRVVGSLAESEPGRLGRDLRQIHAALQTGAPFAVALGMIPYVPERIIRLIVAAERMGRLPQVLGNLIQQRQAAISRDSGRISFYRVYPLVLGTVYIGVTAMIFVFVIPKFMVIFKDFGVPLPQSTLLLIKVANVWGPFLILVSVLCSVVLVWIPIGYWWPGPIAGVMEVLTNWLFNYVPFIGQMRLQNSTAAMLSYCAEGIESGYGLEACLSEAAELTPNRRLRRQLIHWNNRLRAGEQPAAAARAAGMPPMLCGMIASSVTTGDLAEVFRFLSRYYAHRHAAAAALLEASILPVCAIVMGLLVGWLMVSLLLPMVELINRCIPYPTGF